MQWTKNKILVFFYFFTINLPLMIATFHTTNWSDDYQYANLIALKAKFSPLSSLIFNEIGGDLGGGHIVPVYILFNLLVTSISKSPVFFHCVIMLFYILTSYFIFLIVEKYFDDRSMGLLAGTLFAVNYYTAFKSVTWNIFHAHATNTLTGTISVYCLLRFIQEKKGRFLALSGLCLFLSIHNFESGYVFFPILGLMALYFWAKKMIDFKKFFMIAVTITMVVATQPIASYLATGKAVALGHRFGYSRNIQNYAFVTNELFYKSIGLSTLFNELVFNKMKENVQLKEAVIKLIRQNDKSALKEISLQNILTFGVVGIMTFLLAIYLLVLIFTRIRKETLLFVYLFACLFFIFAVVFYRVDIANAIAVFSSIIIADMVISLLRDNGKNMRRLGTALIGLYAFVTIWTITDRFDDCYQKSYYGISAVAVKGPDILYNDINKRVGHFIDKGLIWLTHDHSMYSRTAGFERIGDMLHFVDFLSYNATVFEEDFLKTDLVEEYKDKTLEEFQDYFRSNPKNKRFYVDSKEEAIRLIKEQNISLDDYEVVYISKDYQITYLNEGI